jgi:hypothetical protein
MWWPPLVLILSSSGESWWNAISMLLEPNGARCGVKQEEQAGCRARRERSGSGGFEGGKRQRKEEERERGKEVEAGESRKRSL